MFKNIFYEAVELENQGVLVGLVSIGNMDLFAPGSFEPNPPSMWLTKATRTP